MSLFEQINSKNRIVIAEPACGHEGQFERMERLIECAADCGAGIIKFQIFTTEERAIKGGTFKGISEWDLFDSLTFSATDWGKLAKRARDLKLIILADIFGEESLLIANQLDVDGFKIHSEDLLNTFFISKVAELNKIMLIGVGGAHRNELYNLLNHLEKNDFIQKTILMTGVQNYPTTIESHSLNEITDLIEKYSHYGVKFGFSDHISGDKMESMIIPFMALAKGASFIEKHYTINREDKWIDYESALDKNDFSRFIQNINSLSPCLKEFGPFKTSEKEYRQLFKKTIFSKRPILKNQIITREDITFKKDTKNSIPLTSLNVVGLKSNCDIPEGEQLRNKLLSQKIGIIIVARCTSSRLPGKALRLISGKESIVQVINRMKRCKIPEHVILATSTDSTDDILVEIAQREGIAFYRGSLSEVAKRYLGAAHQYELNHFVRVTGDALLCDEIMVDKAIESHLYNSCDITFMKNMPFGTHKEIVSINALETIVKMAEEPDKTEYLEYYLENERYFSVNYCHSDYNFDSKLRLTLDYEEDLKLFNTIYSHFDNIGNTDFTLSEAIHWLGENPEIAKINMDRTQKFKLHETKNFYSQDLNVRLKI